MKEIRVSPKSQFGKLRFSIILFHTLLSLASVSSRIESIKPKMFEGDIMMSRKDMKALQSEILFTGKVYSVHIWKEGIIPYEISPKFEAKHKALIMEAMDEISGDTCIQFVPRRKERDYIEFVKSDSKCSARVGKTGKRQEVLMSPNTCMRQGTVVHELLHTLGLYHEQSRPDRDKFITVVWDNLRTPASKINFETYQTKFWRDHNDLPYDYGSIMHYSSEAFTKKGGSKTILTKTQDAPIGQRTSMSHFDKVKINLMYNCKFNE